MLFAEAANGVSAGVGGVSWALRPTLFSDRSKHLPDFDEHRTSKFRSERSGVSAVR